jgi:hypothetical protein
MFGADLSDSVDTISSEGRPPNIRKAASERAIHSAEASERLYPDWPSPVTPSSNSCRHARRRRTDAAPILATLCG